MGNTTTAGAVEQLAVTQSDRDAAAPFANCLSDMQDLFDGKADGLPVVQAFARHRISHSLPRDVGTTLAGLEWSEDGYSLRTPFDGDVDGDGRHVVVGGETVATFADSDVGDEYRERILAALTPSALSGNVGKHVETLNWLSSQYLPGGPYDVKGAISAAVDALTPKVLCQHGHTDPMKLCNDCEAEPSALSGDAGEGE